MLKIHSIETFWTHEWPWIRFVLFLQWCQIKCLYCHNPDTQNIDWWILMSHEEILKKIYKNKPYFWNKWGFTVSWWEPLLQTEELIPLFKELKKEGIHTAIDTNGFILNQKVKELLEYTDLVLLDLKHPDNDWSKIITNWFWNENTIEFAKYLEEINKKWWLRYVFVPSYTWTKENIVKLGELIKNYKSLEKIEILPYHTLWVYKYTNLWIDYKLKDINPPNKEDLDGAINILQKYINEDKIFIR